MNEYDAKEILLKEFDKSCRNYLYQNAHKIDLENALFMGAEALKKQIATKPELWGDGVDADMEIIYDMYDCPNCGKSYELDYDEYDYCPKCGQKLDWSNIDE